MLQGVWLVYLLRKHKVGRPIDGDEVRDRKWHLRSARISANISRWKVWHYAVRTTCHIVIIEFVLAVQFRSLFWCVI